eukprot:CAMPEP_0184865042 /NCGR_PEP_ID=MMETSP0580-20130426/16754_1 /TAXON_ID=1118495 /ORGANISM="Dactyliosolen fragilissimus" /LENGTH=108 /DNA_ID=CAMNT_0027364057 /DNA_START=871 /DNA_END=1197 /DNA_ORIENTATION=+
MSYINDDVEETDKFSEFLYQIKKKGNEIRAQPDLKNKTELRKYDIDIVDPFGEHDMFSPKNLFDIELELGTRGLCHRNPEEKDSSLHINPLKRVGKKAVTTNDSIEIT